MAELQIQSAAQQANADGYILLLIIIYFNLQLILNYFLLIF